MIRREDLSKAVGILGTTTADVVAISVKRGESVRIVGLGTLSAVLYGDIRKDPPRDSYRLTLTAAVVKAWERKSPAGFDRDVNLLTDVRHIARSLGAPVEVWSPWMTGRPNREPTIITTVHP